MGYRTKTITVIRPKNNSAAQATGLASVSYFWGCLAAGGRFIFGSPKWIKSCPDPPPANDGDHPRRDLWARVAGPSFIRLPYSKAESRC